MSAEANESGPSTTLACLAIFTYSSKFENEAEGSLQNEHASKSIQIQAYG